MVHGPKPAFVVNFVLGFGVEKESGKDAEETSVLNAPSFKLLVLGKRLQTHQKYFLGLLHV